MATEKAMDDMAQLTHPITIGGRTDVAKVVFQDGYTISYPSMVSTASVSSIPTTPSTYRSRSSSQRRGRRDRASSYSSTGSVRDILSHLSMPSIMDELSQESDSTMTMGACSAPGRSHPPTSDLDYPDYAEEWGTATMRPEDFAMGETAYSPSPQHQNHLVAGTGGTTDGPTHFTNMDRHVDDVFLPQNIDIDDVYPDDSNLSNFYGASSALVGPSYMAYARQDHSVLPMTAIREGNERSLKLASATASKAIRKPGRALGSKLPEDKRQKVAIMRRVGACTYCKEGRRGCDPGTPCKPCILHFGADILDEPNHCRKDIISHLCGEILSKTCKWHPHPRDITDFFGRDIYVADWRYEIPIQFGFGPVLRASVCVLQTSEPSHLQHKHVHYASPLATRPDYSHDYVLPVTFADPSQLFLQIDRHLSMLIDNNFRQFPIFNSRFQILDKILKLYIHFRHHNQEYARLLHQALKLLVLVHNSEIDVSMSDVSVQHILKNYSQGYNGRQRVTPCGLRAELGKVVPQLARLMLEDILQRLLRITLAHRCDQHPIVVASFAVLMMTIESIMYHSSRIGYHAHASLPGPAPKTTFGSPSDKGDSNPFESITHPVEAAAAVGKLETAATELQTIYRNCFENCHKLLLRPIEERHFTSLQKQFGDPPASFIVALNQAIGDSAGYLEMRVSEKMDSTSDPSLFFDRLLARLFLLQTDLSA